MDPLFLQFLTGSIIGLGAGYIGSFMVLRRMALVGDALSHVALPGIALALLWHINPFIGAFTLLLLAILGIWRLELKTNLPSETLVGIFFTLSLAIGLLITPEPELLEALFGDLSKVTLVDFGYALVLVPFLLAEMRHISRDIMLGIISPEMAQTMGVKIDRTQLKFLLMVAVIVALGLKVVGTLLMGSLVIIPAAAARNISTNLSRYTTLSAIFGALSAGIGVLAALTFGIAPGPAVVLTSGLIFVSTLVFKPQA